jgi:hypothetical protein
MTCLNIILVCFCSPSNNNKSDTKTWKEIEPKGIKPSERWGHVAVVREKSMVIFGGYGSPLFLNDLHEFNFGRLLGQKNNIKKLRHGQK